VRYEVFILNELHMPLQAAFNGLLKVLAEHRRT
jgi:DNA polymerase III gamma/tau subunit